MDFFLINYWIIYASLHENEDRSLSAFSQRDKGTFRNRGPSCDRLAIIAREASPCLFERSLVVWEARARVRSGLSNWQHPVLHVVHESFPISRNRTRAVCRSEPQKDGKKKMERGRKGLRREMMLADAISPTTRSSSSSLWSYWRVQFIIIVQTRRTQCVTCPLDSAAKREIRHHTWESEIWEYIEFIYFPDFFPLIPCQIHETLITFNYKL